MPVKIKKLPKTGLYQVSTPNQVHAKGTTKENALAQERLLNAIDHGWKPTGAPAKKEGGSHSMGEKNKGKGKGKNKGKGGNKPKQGGK